MVAVSTKSFILKYLSYVTLLITVVASKKCSDYGYNSNGVSIYTSMYTSRMFLKFILISVGFFLSLVNGYS